MGTQHEGETRWSADRLIAVRELETHPTGGKSIDIGSLGDAVAVTAEDRLQVIDENHKYVWLVRQNGIRSCAQRRYYEAMQQTRRYARHRDPFGWDKFG